MTALRIWKLFPHPRACSEVGAQLCRPSESPWRGQVGVTGLLGTDKLAGYLAHPEGSQGQAVRWVEKHRV